MAHTPLGWYKWYPRDFMASSKVRRMSITAQGVYRALLDLQWEDGNVPETYVEAKLILGLTEVEAMSFEVFYDLCFPGGKNPKLHSQRSQQLAFIEAQKEKGGRPKKGDSGSNEDKKEPSQNLGLTKPKLTPNQTETKKESIDILDKSNIYAKRFSAPSVEDVKDYATEKALADHAHDFCDFYGSKGWMVGQNKMKDWKLAYGRWCRNQKPKFGPAAVNDPTANSQRFQYKDEEAAS